VDGSERPENREVVPQSPVAGGASGDRKVATQDSPGEGFSSSSEEPSNDGGDTGGGTKAQPALSQAKLTREGEATSAVGTAREPDPEAQTLQAEASGKTDASGKSPKADTTPKSGGSSQSGFGIKVVDSLWSDRPDYTPGPCAYSLFYVLLFFAYFFGSARFDVNHDGEFDVTDVQQFLADRKILKKNFKKVKKQRSLDMTSYESGSAMRTKSSMKSKSSTKSARVVDINGEFVDSGHKHFFIEQKGKEVSIKYGKMTWNGTLEGCVLTLTIQNRSFRGYVLANGDVEFAKQDQKGIWHKLDSKVGKQAVEDARLQAQLPPPPPGDKKLSESHALDEVRMMKGIMGQAHHLLDLAAEAEAHAEGVATNMLVSEVYGDVGHHLESQESHIYHKIVEEQNLPKFVIFEVFVIFGLWIACAIVEWTQGEVPNVFEVLAGLETLAPGKTMLALTNQDCEDFRPQVWRWLSYQFSHKGIAHVGLNALMIALLGIPLEGCGGTRRMFALFNAGVIGGAICYIVGDGHRSVVGASGGVYTLFAMHFSDLFLNWRQKKFRIPTLIFLLILVGVDLGSYFGSQDSHTISGTAHVGGFITGILLGIATGKNYEVLMYERVFQIICGVLAFGCLVFGIVWMALNEDGPRNIFEDCGWCWVRQVRDIAFGPAACAKCGAQECQDYWTNYCIQTFTCKELLSVSTTSCDAHSAVWIEPPGGRC
jgi:membrane associated rhomboid family serine protease